MSGYPGWSLVHFTTANQNRKMPLMFNYTNDLPSQESRNWEELLCQYLWYFYFNLPVEQSVLNATQISVIHMFSPHTPGSWVRMGLLKQWRTSATLRSPAESDSGRTLRNAVASTTRKWAERLPSSPGQTERIPGSAASEMECDEMGRYRWTGWDGAS